MIAVQKINESRESKTFIDRNHLLLSNIRIIIIQILSLHSNNSKEIFSEIIIIIIKEDTRRDENEVEILSVFLSCFFFHSKFDLILF